MTCSFLQLKTYSNEKHRSKQNSDRACLPDASVTQGQNKNRNPKHNRHIMQDHLFPRLAVAALPRITDKSAQRTLRHYSTPKSPSVAQLACPMVRCMPALSCNSR